MSTVAQKIPLSVLLEQKNDFFMRALIQESAQTKTEIVNRAIDLYRKYTLRKQIEKGFQAQGAEDLTLAMSDFDDYYHIINQENESATV